MLYQLMQFTHSEQLYFQRLPNIQTMPCILHWNKMLVYFVFDNLCLIFCAWTIMFWCTNATHADSVFCKWIIIFWYTHAALPAGIFCVWQHLTCNQPFRTMHCIMQNISNFKQRKKKTLSNKYFSRLSYFFYYHNYQKTHKDKINI